MSGVVLFARNSKAAQRLAEQFEKRQVAKVYWGIVEGNVEPAEGPGKIGCSRLRRKRVRRRSRRERPGPARRC